MARGFGVLAAAASIAAGSSGAVSAMPTLDMPIIALGICSPASMPTLAAENLNSMMAL